MVKNTIRLIGVISVAILVANCVGFGQEKLISVNITPPAKKFEKTVFAYTLKYFNAFGVEIGVAHAENEAFEKAVKEEVEACKCFKEYEILELKDFSKEKLPKNTSVIYYDIQYKETTNPVLRTLGNFVSLGTLGIIPAGYHLEISTDVKLYDKSAKELKAQMYKNQITLIGGTSMVFVIPFMEERPFILSGVTNQFLSGLVGANLITFAR
ncbi:hypothetical protein CH365_19440 [Leptospira neocaledonica]|uniref:Uncharacterized protein n=2 Tax=Leptospira neocaledonica TaxID=2023192 RepID=A0A2M9ZTC7_9LEPT|nr:hypothetical protein CH365_19440 [Leptospira neocaledonica]